MSGREPKELLTTLLRDVSRSFYLTLWLLPRGVRRPIALGYLLARATDTIADTGLVPVGERVEALEVLRRRIEGERLEAVDFTRLAEAQDAGASPAERVLLNRVEEAVQVLETLDTADAERVRWVLRIITSGQVLDLQRFGGVHPPAVVALPEGEALDDYTYRVAGCVGEFWTRLCRAHRFPEAQLDEAQLLRDAVRFGKGLQLVNILRDLPRDLAQGRCYLPLDELTAVGLRPEDLRDPANERRLLPVYQRWLSTADEHLTAGWRYCMALPRGEWRLRAACALPVLIGIRTLARLRRGGFLDPRHRIKVGRPEVRAILWRSLVLLPTGKRWDGLADWARFQD